MPRDNTRARSRARLSYTKIEALKTPGTYEDGAGLRLVVTDAGTKRWVLRATIGGHRVNRGLGVYRRSELAAVRKRADAIREAARAGRDLVAEERLEVRRRAAAGDGESFSRAFDAYWRHKASSLRNTKHRQQWQNTLVSYVFPVIGDRPVADIAPSEIIQVLEPIWRIKPETASRVLQRMRAVFDAAIVREVRNKANPCTGVTTVLGPVRKSVTRRRALRWSDVPRFVADLRAGPAKPITRLAFEFLILTAARSEEVRCATWAEIDLGEQLWTIPAERMKANREHRVPLSPRAIEILVRAQRLSGGSSMLIFPAARGGPLSDNVLSQYCRDAGEPCTPHGFRSSFKDWCAEHDVKDEVSEVALAHVDRNSVRTAYRRTDYLDDRRVIMELWAKNVLNPPVDKNI